MAEKTLTIHFADGKFNFTPESWDYQSGDQITFECNRGPFTVVYRPFDIKDKTPIDPPRVSPFGNDGNALLLRVESEKDPLDAGRPTERFVTKTLTVVPQEVNQFGIHPVQESVANEAKSGQKAIAIFHYDVSIQGEEVTSGEQRNGIWVCGS